MKIQRIKIKNFRSIKELDLEIGDLNTIVGQNNHGKTNVFEALDWFYKNKNSSEEHYFNKDKGLTIEVEAEYVGVGPADTEKLGPTNKTKIENLLGENSRFAIRKTSENHKREYMIDGVAKGNPSGLDTAINEFLPKLEYVSTKMRPKDISEYKERNPIGAMLSGVLSLTISDSEQYKAFRSQFRELFESDESEVRKILDELGGKVTIHLERQFPNNVKVRFSASPPEFGDLLKNFETSIDDGGPNKCGL